MGASYKQSVFTPDQMRTLAANPYTETVDCRHISYTLAFKTHFLTRYEQGATCIDIFEDCGYDTELLGANRVYSFARRLRKQMQTGKPVKPEDSDAEPVMA